MITTDLVAIDDPGNATWDILNDVIGDEDTWKQNVINISAYSGPVFIAFRYDDYYGAEWWIDIFQVVEPRDINGLVENLNSGNPEPDVFVEVFNDIGFYKTFTSDPQGKFLAESLPPRSYDILLSKDEFFDALHEDIIVQSPATTTVTVEIEPIAPALLSAQYNDQQVTLECEKASEPEMDNIEDTIIFIKPGRLRPLRTVRASFRPTAQSLLRLSRRRETRVLLFVFFTTNVVNCLHSFAKSNLHFFRWKRCLSNSGMYGLTLLFTFT